MSEGLYSPIWELNPKAKKQSGAKVTIWNHSQIYISREKNFSDVY